MKKYTLFLLFIVIFMSNMPAQEIQFSSGAELGLGVFSTKIDKDVRFRQGGLLTPPEYLLSEERESIFLAPGFSSSMRVFGDTDSSITSGFFFRNRWLLAIELLQTGEGYRYNSLTSSGDRFIIDESYSIGDGGVIMGFMDLALGSSARFKIAQRLSFYADFGFSFTMMYFDNITTRESLDYLGVGIFSVLAMQVDITKTVYFELGINSNMNIFSAQQGEYFVGIKKYEYEDTGRWDLTTMAAYLHIGWHLDLKR